MLRAAIVFLDVRDLAMPTNSSEDVVGTASDWNTCDGILRCWGVFQSSARAT